MKIRDIIREAVKKGKSYGQTPKLDKHYADSLGRVDRFHHPEKADKAHSQYRLMMAAAESDGSPDQVLTTDANSWADVDNFAVPYSDLEGQMLDRAYNHLGVPAHKNITGDKKRHENAEVNTASPVQSRGPVQLRKK